LTASAISSSAINISWQDISSAEEGYKVERKSQRSSQYLEIARLAPNTSKFQDNNLISSTIYCYRVKSFTASIESANSLEAEAKTSDPTPPPNPIKEDDDKKSCGGTGAEFFCIYIFLFLSYFFRKSRIKIKQK